MRRFMIPGLVMLLALAACAPAPASPTAAAPALNTANAPTVSVPITGDTETATIPPVGGDITGTSTADAALATATSETPSEAGSTIDTGVRISTSTSVNTSEPFLVDQLGRALYLYTTDTQNSGTSACTAECLTQWQPVIVTGTPQAGNGVNASLLGTVNREDGTLQASYNGWPLYTYTGDMAPGTIKGQGMESAWFLVSGAGNSIQ
jgi:predicted lipoprotein with Yx(FWY)xxD motif